MTLNSKKYPVGGIVSVYPILSICIILKQNKFMKKQIVFLSMVLVIASIFSSCKKDSTTPKSPNVPAGKALITCDYSGSASGKFSSDVNMGSSLKSVALINLSGGALSGGTSVSTATVVLPLNIAVNNHVQGTDGTADGIVFALTINNGSKGWSIGGAGTKGFSVKITRNDATGIEGTFQGQIGNDTDKSVVTISNGTFKGTF